MMPQLSNHAVSKEKSVLTVDQYVDQIFFRFIYIELTIIIVIIINNNNNNSSNKKYERKCW